MQNCAPTDTPEIDRDARRATHLFERDKRLRPDGNSQYLVTEGEFGDLLQAWREAGDLAGLELRHG